MIRAVITLAALSAASPGFAQVRPNTPVFVPGLAMPRNPSPPVNPAVREAEHLRQREADARRRDAAVINRNAMVNDLKSAAAAARAPAADQSQSTDLTVSTPKRH